MKNILLLLAVFAIFFIASQSALAAGGWWNESWHFRIPVNVSFPSLIENASVNVSVNFTSVLNTLGISGTFDRNSIRVVENNSDIPNDFLNTSLTAGNVSWIVNGTTPAGINRTFHIYFDILENGAKTAGKLISESCNNYFNGCYWRSGYANSMNVWSNQSGQIGYEWNRSWAQSIEVRWKWSTELGFDYAYLYVNGALQSQRDGSGSENILTKGSRLSARFTSDSSTISSATDSYGTYGTAVDTIKFYPTANYATGAFTAVQAAAEKQYSPSLSNIAVSPSTGGWGETFNYTLNASDPEGDNISVTLFTNENGIWNRKATLSGNGILNWTISPFSCSDIGPLNYMFEYNDSYHVPVNSSNYSQTLEKDDILLEYYAGNASVNREGNDNITFGIRVNDTDRKAYVSGESVIFWSYYSNAWNNIGTNATVSGTALYNFNPNCSQNAGANIWKTNYSGTCYKTSESANFTYTVLGQLKNYLMQPLPIEFDLGTPVPIEANITDECSNPVTGATVNFTVNNTNYSAEDQGYGKYNYSFDSTGKATGNYTIQINASKLFYIFNLTSWLNSFRLVAGPPQINISLNATQAAQDSIVQINASVADMSGFGINWVRINITYPNSTIMQYNMTNNSGIWQTILNDTLQRGQYNITVYALDNAGKAGNRTNSTKIYARIINDISTVLESNIVRFRIYIHEINNISLSGASVNLRIDDSSGWNIFNQTYITNSNGRIEPVPEKSSLISGVYNWTANVTYNDSIVSLVDSNTTRSFFSVQSSGAVSLFYLDLASPSEVAAGSSLEVTAVTTNNTMNIDIDSAKASLYDSAGNLIIQNVTMSKTGIGVYVRNYTTSSSSNQGSWKWVVFAVKDSQELRKDIYTRLVGGPFDVRNISAFDKTIPTLGISVIVENTGQGGQDVTMEWNLTRTDTGARLTGGSDTIYVAGGSTKTYSISPSTNYLGEVKIAFLAHYSGTEKAGAYSIFTTEQEAAQAQPPSVGGVSVTPTIVSANISAKIEIIEYPAEIEIERGWAKFITVVVNNTGSGILHNVSVKILDIPEEWFEVQTARVAEMSESKNFLIRFAIPSAVKSGNYKAKLKAISAESSDEKDVIVRVFGSRDELIKYQIETIKEKILYLEALLNQTEREGKDTKRLREALGDIKLHATKAEDYLNKRKYDDAASTINTIKELLNKLESELDDLRKEKAESPLLFLFMFGMIGLVAVLILSFIYLSRKIKVSEAFMLRKFFEIKKMILGKATGRELRKDMEKTRKMIKLIQKEYNEGLITKETYEELKKTNEEKLLASGKKLSELGIKE